MYRLLKIFRSILAFLSVSYIFVFILILKLITNNFTIKITKLFHTVTYQYHSILQTLSIRKKRCDQCKTNITVSVCILFCCFTHLLWNNVKILVTSLYGELNSLLIRVHKNFHFFIFILFIFFFLFFGKVTPLKGLSRFVFLLSLQILFFRPFMQRTFLLKVVVFIIN